tara:strand:- start:59 stop:388 length:330 start_codon:yes stop_codon:yes gene_type:complete
MIQIDERAHKDAVRNLLVRYVTILVENEKEWPENCPTRTQPENLIWMCETAITNLDDFPIDKTNRWLGFVQGCMAVYGMIDVDEERNLSRPLFHSAYVGNEKFPSFEKQ